MVGADAIVSPNAIGALRMASEMIRPTVVDFLDTLLRSKGGTLRINEMTISENSAFEGTCIGDSKIKEKFGLLILGIKESADDIAFNPPASQILKKGMTLITMGDVADMKRAEKIL
jgi:voltage-gated potassium channel